MLELLQKEGHISTIASVCSQCSVQDVQNKLPNTMLYIESLVHARDDLNALTQNDLNRLAYAWIDRALPALVRKIRSRCVPFQYTKELAAAEVPELLDRFAVGLPPSEIGMWPVTSPVDWRSSLLAGWITRLGSADVLNSAQSRIHHVNKLTMKGIEDAVLADEYRHRFPGAR